jgi:hypothetical protein
VGEGLNLFCSFSGGETSALMTRLLLTRWRAKYDQIVVVFANTGEENEETLQFVHECDQRLGFGTVWVEAVVRHGERVSTGHKVVTFETASRKGEPFEEVIKKYGLPGPGRLHCTRELKLNPMLSYLDSIGWERGTYARAIGIRADEKERRSPSAEEDQVLYPLMDWEPLGKPHVNEFWMRQPFRLNLTGYQGNCKWCWKKSMRKHMTLLSETPEKYDFPERMETLYGTVGHEFEEQKAVYEQRVLFRGNLSTKDLRAAYELNKDSLEKAEDDSITMPNGTLIPLDLEDGDCVESCEVDFKEAA